MPRVGSRKKGVGEKTFIAKDNSGLPSIDAITLAPHRSTNENTAPKKKNKYVIFLIISLAYIISYLGRKYEYALGKPNEKTASNVL